MKNTIRRVRALSEYRRKFRAWLASYERKEAYDKTRRKWSKRKYKEWRNYYFTLCVWPFNSDIPEEKASYEKQVKIEILKLIRAYYEELRESGRHVKVKKEGVIHEMSHPIYNLDGYALKFKGGNRV